jgi:hypothetical protein
MEKVSPIISEALNERVRDIRTRLNTALERLKYVKGCCRTLGKFSGLNADRLEPNDVGQTALLIDLCLDMVNSELGGVDGMMAMLLPGTPDEAMAMKQRHSPSRDVRYSKVAALLRNHDERDWADLVERCARHTQWNEAVPLPNDSRW